MFEELIFASASELSSGENPAIVNHGDMDGDGLEDLVAIGESANIRGSDSTTLISTHRNNLEFTCLGDFDLDNFVNINDLLLLMAAWGECDAVCIEDLDGDGTVNVSDILIFLSLWGPCE